MNYVLTIFRDGTMGKFSAMLGYNLPPLLVIIGLRCNHNRTGRPCGYVPVEIFNVCMQYNISVNISKGGNELHTTYYHSDKQAFQRTVLCHLENSMSASTLSKAKLKAWKWMKKEITFQMLKEKEKHCCCSLLPCAVVVCGTKDWELKEKKIQRGKK